MDTLIFEVGTALVLVAFAAILAAKLKFSIIPFLIILGMLVGPHAPDLGLIDLRFIESGSYFLPRPCWRYIPLILFRLRILN